VTGVFGHNRTAGKTLNQQAKEGPEQGPVQPRLRRPLRGMGGEAIQGRAMATIRAEVPVLADDPSCLETTHVRTPAPQKGISTVANQSDRRTPTVPRGRLACGHRPAGEHQGQEAEHGEMAVIRIGRSRDSGRPLGCLIGGVPPRPLRWWPDSTIRDPRSLSAQGPISITRPNLA